MRRRVAIVTGAGSGIGAATALALAAEDWTVVLAGRRSEALQAVAEQDSGGRLRPVPTDVTDEASVRALVAAAEDELGPVQVVVANATGPQPAVPVEELTWQDHLDQLRFFVLSPTLLVQATLPTMKRLGSGRVIQIGSDVVDRGLAGTSAYTAAKAAQIGLTRSWCRELGPHGVTVNLVAPGWIPVERHGEADTSGYLADVPLGRMGTPADVAGLVAYLAGDAAAFVTGQHISVNGGHTLG